jgi:hypothetical protein
VLNLSATLAALRCNHSSTWLQRVPNISTYP